jgi:hypothetical protein
MNSTVTITVTLLANRDDRERFQENLVEVVGGFDAYGEADYAAVDA